MQDEELLNLYAQDQEERRQFSLLKNDAKKESMRELMQKNDVKRREAVSDLIPLNSKVMRAAEDYYIAAIIYSRGESVGDRKKAQGYAKKAYAMVQYRHDDFADKVKDLYEHTNRRLVRKVPQEPMTNTPLQKQLNMKAVQKRKAEERDRFLDRRAERQDRINDRLSEQQDRENDRLSARERALENKPKPRCFSCGREHGGGPCPPR